MPIYTKEEQFKLIEKDWESLIKIDNQYEEVCLEAVKINAYALEYVKEQTPKICLEAVKKDGWVLRYVKEQTEEMCLEAIKQEGANIQYVKNKTPKLCFYAFLNDYDLLNLKYMKQGIYEFIDNQTLENKIFSSKRFEVKNENFYYVDEQSLIYLKDYLLTQINNKYILDDNIDVEILKDIALSNNELIIVDTGNIKNIHKKLANRIVKEDLEKESF